ncbi:VTT domain-containing protein [Candidatus Woesearchaeota archaeon]|nr:VTT domain-containing protein [Candidatus Woesearchaeota archaeon]
MKNRTISFKEDGIFSYDRFNKIGFGLSLIVLIAVVVLLGITYFFQRNSDVLIFKVINIVITHFTSHISDVTPLGILYTTLIGGLFFVSMPLELLFIKFLNAGNPIIVLFLFYFLGLIVSFTINYFIGLKLSALSKRIISPKKFYKTKGVLNRYGALAIFAFNALPLPAQLLTVILGVFRYNKTRFYVFFLSGQLAKYLVITVFTLFF